MNQDLREYVSIHDSELEMLEQAGKALKIVFITPEKLNKNVAMRDLLIGCFHNKRVQRIVIDEAHCLSQWGHEFRIDYLQMDL